MEMEQNYMVMSEGMEDREVTAVVTTWWCHRGEMQGRVVE